MAKRAQGLREKIPDIKKTLEMVRFLRVRRDVSFPITPSIHYTYVLYACCIYFVYMGIYIWIC